MSAQSAGSSGSLTTRGGLKPERRRRGDAYATLRQGHDERTERLRGSSTTARLGSRPLHGGSQYVRRYARARLSSAQVAVQEPELDLG